MKKIVKITSMMVFVVLCFSLCTVAVRASNPDDTGDVAPPTSSGGYQHTIPGYGDPVSCGNINNIPPRIPKMVSSLIDIVQVLTPVLLVIFGVIDLIKGITSQKAEEIQKSQHTLVKRIVIGSLIFLVIVFAKFLVNVAANGSENKRSIINCIECFVNNNCSA